jgi:adenylyl-sulfate kinase
MSRAFTVWLTGMSGAGKTTIARRLTDLLVTQGESVEMLDGDEIRRIGDQDLGFSATDRASNVRRIGYIARLLSRNGVIAVVACISPYRALRREVRDAHEATFIEVFVDCPLEELIRRDTKGLYRNALRGDIPNLTGISDPYEPPVSPDVHLLTNTESIEACIGLILDVLQAHGLRRDLSLSCGGQQ